jgi:hypothetical protein
MTVGKTDDVKEEVTSTPDAEKERERYAGGISEEGLLWPN